MAAGQASGSGDATNPIDLSFDESGETPKKRQAASTTTLVKETSASAITRAPTTNVPKKRKGNYAIKSSAQGPSRKPGKLQLQRETPSWQGPSAAGLGRGALSVTIPKWGMDENRRREGYHAHGQAGPGPSTLAQRNATTQNGVMKPPVSGSSTGESTPTPAGAFGLGNSGTWDNPIPYISSATNAAGPRPSTSALPTPPWSANDRIPVATGRPAKKTLNNVFTRMNPAKRKKRDADAAVQNGTVNAHRPIAAPAPTGSAWATSAAEAPPVEAAEPDDKDILDIIARLKTPPPHALAAAPHGSSSSHRMLSVEIPLNRAADVVVEREIEDAHQEIAGTDLLRDDSPDIEMLDDTVAARIAWKPSQRPSKVPMMPSRTRVNLSPDALTGPGPSNEVLRRSGRSQGARPPPTYRVEAPDEFFASLQAPSSPMLEPGVNGEDSGDDEDGSSSAGEGPRSEEEDEEDLPPKYSVQELREIFDRMRSEAEAEAKARTKRIPSPAGRCGDHAVRTVNGEDRTIHRYFPLFTPPPSDDAADADADASTDDPSPSSGIVISTVPADEQPVPDRRGIALRDFDESSINEWAKNRAIYADNRLYRTLFENWMWESADQAHAPEIRVISTGPPPEVEFQYSNDRLYHHDVPDPEYSVGCDCEGGCDPHSTTCKCLKIQKLYSYDVGLDGFACDANGLLKNAEVPVWECGPHCGCGPDCMNRVIQRGRPKHALIDLVKTKKKGWGVQVREAARNGQRYRRDGGIIPRGTFLGVYTGELITEAESERRGTIYEKIGRTYLFDCDGWQIANPPPIHELNEIDPRLAHLAARAAEKARQAKLDREADDDSSYSSYSVDAFHFGNFTRYFNHSCDPNLAITQAYVTDFNPERPSLVIFTRRDVRPGEELCISYKGLPDTEETEEDRRRRIATGRLEKGKKRKAKTSAVAHAGKESQGRLTHDTCHCGAWNCNGKMWNAAQTSDHRSRAGSPAAKQ